MQLVRARLPEPRDCVVDITFIAELTHPHDLERGLGPLAGFLGKTTWFRGRVDDGRSRGTSPTLLVVRSLANDIVEVDGVRLSLPFLSAPFPEDGPRRRFQDVHFHFRTEDTVAHAVQIMAGIYDRYRLLDEAPGSETLIELGSSPSHERR